MSMSIKRMLIVLGTVTFLAVLSGCHPRSTAPQEIDLADTDNDNIPNVYDPDIDNDNIPNIVDNDIDGDGIDNINDPDFDGDGIGNIDDNDIDGDGIVNDEDADIDNDGKRNFEDNDIDGDGIDNIDDNDIDGDGIINEQDPDIDGDGSVNEKDTDLDGDGIANEDDIDIDGDGIVNSEDSDIDNDGIPNDADDTKGGTGNEIAGTDGDKNEGSDKNEGTVNTGTDKNEGETDVDVPVEGVNIVAFDTVGYTFTIDNTAGGGSITTTEKIDLQEARAEIADNEIALATFSLTDLSIIASDRSSSFIEANRDTRIVINVSYLEGDHLVPVLRSADNEEADAPILTIGDLASAEGLHLDNEIFIAREGYAKFVNMIKDESQPDVESVIEIEFLDPPVGSGELNVDFILEATGVKPF